MRSALDVPDISRIYASFTALTASFADLGGSLLLNGNLSADGAAVAIAANIAGAASLSIEPDAVRAKAALRSGVCDFVVNNLDEALRILKNEIRKKRAVSVVLIADPDTVASEIVERGVQPEILVFAVPQLIERGARMLPPDAADGLIPIAWSVDSASTRWLPALDKLAAASLTVKDTRHRWLEASPRYLGRTFAGQRFLRMSKTEAGDFTSAARGAVQTGAIPVPVSIILNGEMISIAP